MRNYIIILCIILISIIGSSCKKEKEEINLPTSINADIKGYVQKGPFISGTNIAINELHRDLSQTGSVFSTQIISNTGDFEIEELNLASNYVDLYANGFYFNEVSGEQSVSQISLGAIADVADSNVVNINILSHLEKLRVEYLVQQGDAFEEAKQQAQAEVLSIFNINNEILPNSERLNISEEGDENAILLAVSVLSQGFRVEAELTELLSNIRLDIKEDGVLNNQDLGSELINHAIFLDTLKIESNLQQRYADLGITIDTLYFGKYIENFIRNTSFEITEELVQYPSVGSWGPNILDPSLTQCSQNGTYSISAILGGNSQLRIKITKNYGDFLWQVGSDVNWVVNWPYLTAINPELRCDLAIMPSGNTELLIEYFEMGSSVPTKIKTIVFQ